MKNRQLLIILVLSYFSTFLCQIPTTTEAWSMLSPDGLIWSGRNAHASCIFKGVVWVVGGHTDSYPTFNLIESDKTADVWYSSNMKDWTQISTIRGDFYAQNWDALQPGPVAPWYARYGHSLDAISVNLIIDNREQEIDLMVLTGGFAPGAMNDVWVTEDGETWFFVQYAPWSPRGWHSTTVYNNTIWLIGGTPLNNEVWVLSRVSRVEDREPPLTRAMYMNYTYNFEWELRNSAAPWSPRCGMGFITQKYPNTVLGYRLVFTGGYGGILNQHDPKFDGLRSRGDVWTTENGINWTMISSMTEFGENAWMGLSIWEPDTTASQPRIWMIGGGYIGDNLNRRVTTMIASVSVYWSRDAKSWIQVNFVSGGGKSTLQRYSSSEWAKTTIDADLYFLGLWGLTSEVYTVDGVQRLYILGGDQDGGGTYKAAVYQGLQGLLCDIEGVTCNGRGSCLTTSTSAGGCVCSGAIGQYCETPVGGRKNSAISLNVQKNHLFVSLILCSYYFLFMYI